MLRRAFCALALLILLAVSVPTLARGDATPQADLALLNQERAAWGLPAGITENTTWSADCAAHDNYERQNGGQLTHTEQPGNPGYSAAGAYAGGHSILSGGVPWLAGASPFETAPIHLIQLFTPSLAQVGIDDSSGYVCVTTFPGMTAAPPAQETITTYPGGGTAGFLTAENARESPFVPGDFVGLPAGTTTGREIFVYLDEPGHTGPAQVTIQQASLTAPSGSLPVKTVDNSTGTIGPYLTGGIIIPAQPLPEGVPINASVTLAGANGPVTHAWTFTTAQAPNASVTVSGTSITFTSGNPTTGLLRIFVPSDSGSYYVLDQPIKPGTSALPTASLPTGTALEACVSQSAASGYDSAHACSPPFTISGDGSGSPGSGPGDSANSAPANPALVSPGATIHTYRPGLSLRGRRLRVSLPQFTLGRRVTITAIYQRRSCHRHRCRVALRATRSRTVLATGPRLTLSLPPVGRANRVKVTVTLATFRAGGDLFRAVPATITGSV